MKKQSRTDHRRRQSELPPPRHLPLVDLLVDTQAELQELVVASGLTVLEAMLEEDRAAVGGPRYAHQPERQAYRAGTGRGSVGASKTFREQREAVFQPRDFALLGNFESLPNQR